MAGSSNGNNKWLNPPVLCSLIDLVVYTYIHIISHTQHTLAWVTQGGGGVADSIMAMLRDVFKPWIKGLFAFSK
jgi:hypothetical protein